MKQDPDFGSIDLSVIVQHRVTSANRYSGMLVDLTVTHDLALLSFNRGISMLFDVRLVTGGGPLFNTVMVQGEYMPTVVSTRDRIVSLSWPYRWSVTFRISIVKKLAAWPMHQILVQVPSICQGSI